MKKILSIRGFTIIELLVAIAIIGVLTSVVLVSTNAARENARDKTRIAEIGQIELALRLYVEQNGSSIDCKNGLKIDGDTNVVSIRRPGTSGVCKDGAAILSFLESFFSSVPQDPSSDADHYYYFDLNHGCKPPAPGVTMLFAVNLESKSSNVLEVCDVQNGRNGGFSSGNPYLVILPFVVQP